MTHAYIGLLGGLHSACWGAYKDSPYEGFHFAKFLRSPLVGFLSGMTLHFFFSYSGKVSVNLSILFVLVVGFERASIEFFKTFIRKKDRFLYRQINRSYIPRILIGLLLTILLLLSVLLARYYTFPSKALLSGFVPGFIGGVLIAAGGYWKDSPFESFYLSIFLRSPLIAGLWGIILNSLSSDISIIALACIGAERMTVEFYKTYLTNKTPSKFASNQVVAPNWINTRRFFVGPYLLTWASFIGLLLENLHWRLGL